MMRLSIIIPAYNEEKRIKETLQKITHYFDKTYFNKKKIIYEIIVVDDGSKDNTIKVLNLFKKNIKVLRNKVNSGKGFSIREGFKKARYEYILFTDADLSTPIEEIEKFLKYLNEYDVLIASRNLKESKIVVKQPLYRILLGKTFPLMVQLFLLPGIKDTQCGFKLFKSPVIKKIIRLQKINRFCFDVEYLSIAKKNGYRIKEIPVVWVDKRGSKVNPFKDSFKMFRDLIKIKYNFIAGKYG